MKSTEILDESDYLQATGSMVGDTDLQATGSMVGDTDLQATGSMVGGH